MKRLKFGKYVYQVTIYDPLVFLEVLQKEKIKIYAFNKVDDYTYRFKASYFYHKRLCEIKGVKFIKKEGFIGILSNLFSYKTTLAAILVASFCLFYVSNLILKISIFGDNQLLYPLVEKVILEEGLHPYIKMPSNERLLQIETKLATKLKGEIEWVQVRKKGSLVMVKFLKRRESPYIPKYNEEVYAQKDGLIAYMRVSSGQIKVKVNQFVRKGDLLISPYIEKTDGTVEWVGTLGSIYAYTWYQLSAEVKVEEVNKLTMDEIYLLLLDRIHTQLDFIINGYDEEIKNEKVLQFEQKESKIILKVHYTLIEDITR